MNTKQLCIILINMWVIFGVHYFLNIKVVKETLINPSSQTQCIAITYGDNLDSHCTRLFGGATFEESEK